MRLQLDLTDFAMKQQHYNSRHFKMETETTVQKDKAKAY